MKNIERECTPMKKFFLTFAAVMIIAVLSAATAFAADPVIAEGKCGDNITWTLYDKSQMAQLDYQLVFKGSGVLLGYNKDGTHTHYGNQKNSQFFDYKDHITSVRIEEGITEVGSFGLAFLNALQVVELPKSVKIIGGAAFEVCSSLRSIYRVGSIPAAGLDLTGIERIDAYAFDACVKASRVTIDKNYKGKLPSESFKNTGILSVVIPEGVSEIAKNAFCNNKSLKFVQFEGDPVIAEGAFSACKIKTVYGTGGGNAERFANSIGAEFSTEKLDTSGNASPYAIAYGSCGDEVYWQILDEGKNGKPEYLFEVFGTGDTMEALDASGNEITYGTSKNLLWHDYVPYIKRVRVGGNVTTLQNCSLAFLTNAEYIELSPKVIYFKSKVFEATSALKSIYITGNAPIDGNADLSNILTHGSYQFDGCRYITSVTFSENMKKDEMPTEFLKSTGIVDFTVPEQFTSISFDAFENCKRLEILRFYGDPVIPDKALDYCTALKRIYGNSGGNVEAYAKKHGIEFVSPLSVKVYSGDTLIYDGGVVEGSRFSEMCFDGTLYLLYTDKALTEPYAVLQGVTEDLILYASPLISSASFSVRTDGYHGLRATYTFNRAALNGNSAYEISEIGAIASGKRGIRMLDLTLDMNHIHSFTIAKNGNITGLLSRNDKGGSADFTLTAIGYGEAPDSFRGSELIYTRAFVKLKEKESGKEFTVYTDIASSDLISAAGEAEREGKLTEDEKAFVSLASSLEKKQDAIYTKEELMTLLTNIYNSKNSYLVGQHCDYGSPDSFANFIDDFYNETGEIPGVIALDQGTMNRSGVLNEEAKSLIAQDIAEYARRGGVFSLSFHMDNPNNEELYCREELGLEDAWRDLMTKGTKRNDSLMKSLESAARTLKDLEREGVPVLFRPLHEMNGGWFWWCTIQSENGTAKTMESSYFVSLWKYFYNYFEVECGLTNLIWVYSPNYTNSTVSPVPVMYCYPGDEYVDIVGCDWYTTKGTLDDIEGSGKSYSTVASTGKIAAMTEFGVRNPLASNSQNVQEKIYNCMNELATYKSIMESGLGLTYVLNWSGSGAAYLHLGKADEYMAAPETLGGADLLSALAELRKTN